MEGNEEGMLKMEAKEENNRKIPKNYDSLNKIRKEF
jgi:hypothetical protein